MKRILIIAVPITLGACIMPLMNLIDASIVSNRLQAVGFSYAETKDLYTELSSFASTIINFPQIIVQSIAISMVPAISMAFREKDSEGLRNNVKMGVRMSNLLSFPCAAGLIILAEPILLLLYSRQADMAVDAAGSLIVLAVGFVFLAIAQTLTGALQGIGKQLVPVRNLCIGAVFKAAVTFILVGIPELNVVGAALGTCAAYIVASVLDVMAIIKYTGTRFDIGLTFIRPAVATLGMAVVTLGSYRLFALAVSCRLAALVSIVLSVIAYAVLVFATKSITMDELSVIPKGDRVAAVLRKVLK